MKHRLVVLFAVLVVSFASAATAMTTLGWDTNTAGDLTTYTYSLTNGEGDYITSLYVFAPLDPGLISGWTAPDNWLFDAYPDPEDPAAGTDICWYAINPNLNGIPDGGWAEFSITVPSYTRVKDDHIVPGCFGNWGYEVQAWPGAVLVSLPPVPVPESCPEPTSIVAILGGLGWLVGMRRKR